MTNSDGSPIKRPSSMMSRNVCCHASPNRMVWWPMPSSTARAAEVRDDRRRRRPQRQQPPRGAAQQAIGVGKLGGQHDGVGR